MRIFDIDIYRDGGSIEFFIEHNGKTRQVWLDTPFRGEPRALRIGSISVNRGESAIHELLTDIDTWWGTFSPDLQKKILEELTRKETRYNPDAETLKASNLSKVLRVRDYVIQNYVA